MEASVLNSHPSLVTAEVLVYGYQRGKVIEKGYKGIVAANSLLQLKQRIFDHCFPFIRGTAVKRADGEIALDPKKETDGYDEFHNHVRLRRRAMVVLNDYSETEASNDRAKKTLVNVCVYVYGLHCDSGTYDTLSASSRSTNRAKVPDNIEFLRVIQLLKDKHGSLYSALDGSWGTWAEYCMRLSKGKDSVLDDLVASPVPEHLMYLFPKSSSETQRNIQQIQHGSTTFLRLLEHMITLEKEGHQRRMTVLESSDQISSSFHKIYLII
jgi:hypothetical protein